MSRRRPRSGSSSCCATTSPTRRRSPRTLGRAHGFTVSHVYRSALKGFAAEVPAQAIAGLERNPRVAFIDRDFEVQAFAQPLPTGVDRIDADTNTTAGIDGVDERVDVDVAVIDTGSGPHVDLNVVGGKDCTGTGSFADNRGHGYPRRRHRSAPSTTTSAWLGVAPGARIHARQGARRRRQRVLVVRSSAGSTA